MGRDGPSWQPRGAIAIPPRFRDGSYRGCVPARSTGPRLSRGDFLRQPSFLAGVELAALNKQQLFTRQKRFGGQLQSRRLIDEQTLRPLAEPLHLVESLKWQVYWFDRYLNGNATVGPPDQPLDK